MVIPGHCTLPSKRLWQSILRLQLRSRSHGLLSLYVRRTRTQCGAPSLLSRTTASIPAAFTYQRHTRLRVLPVHFVKRMKRLLLSPQRVLDLKRRYGCNLTTRRPFHSSVCATPPSAGKKLLSPRASAQSSCYRSAVMLSSAHCWCS